MALTYEELNGMTVAQLCEVAEGQDSDDLKGLRSMHKVSLLELLCKVLGVEQHEHHVVRGIDKAAIKSEMSELKVA